MSEAGHLHHLLFKELAIIILMPPLKLKSLVDTGRVRKSITNLT